MVKVRAKIDYDARACVHACECGLENGQKGSPLAMVVHGEGFIYTYTDGSTCEMKVNNIVDSHEETCPIEEQALALLS